MTLKANQSAKTQANQRSTFDHFAKLYKFSPVKQNDPVTNYLPQKHVAKLNRAGLNPTVKEFFLEVTGEGKRSKLRSLGISITDALIENLRKG